MEGDLRGREERQVKNFKVQEGGKEQETSTIYHPPLQDQERSDRSKDSYRQ